jgi:hypothetical protein
MNKKAKEEQDFLKANQTKDLDVEETSEKVEDKVETINNVSEIKPTIKKSTETS